MSRHVRKDSQEKLAIFTIGHSTHSLEVFIDLLQSHKIDVLLDVRSKPFSRSSPQFNKEELEKAVRAKGIKYLFLGKELGGRPQGSEFYDAKGFVLYSRIAESPLFVEGIDRLIKGIKNYRVTVMCGEENPANCHRRLLVGWVLAERGAGVRHIRGDGAIQEALIHESAFRRYSAFSVAGCSASKSRPVHSYHDRRARGESSPGIAKSPR